MDFHKSLKKLGYIESRYIENIDIDKLHIRGSSLHAEYMDFSHANIDAHEPIPGAIREFNFGYNQGRQFAYTPNKGDLYVRERLAEKISAFTNSKIDPKKNITITPGTHAALFLSIGSVISPGDKVAIIEPDYLDNRRILEFLGAETLAVGFNYLSSEGNDAGIDLRQLEKAFQDGAKLFVFSNPNNPTGAVYSQSEIRKIAQLAAEYDATLIVDQLYCRQVYDDREFINICSRKEINPEKIITIMSPSKTESLNGFSQAVAFGSEEIIDKMESLQDVVALRAAGYSQAVLNSWFDEPDSWLEYRVNSHQEIRDALLVQFNRMDGVRLRPTEAGSNMFVELPNLDIEMDEFVKVLRVLANMVVIPGTEFGPQFDKSILINFSQDKNKAIEGVKRIEEILSRYRR